MRTTQKIVSCATAGVLTLLGSASSVFAAPVLTQVPPWSGLSAGGNTFAGATTEVRAITPDGVYVVGTATGIDTKPDTTTVAATYGMIWDATNGPRKVLSSDSAIATIVTGVGYRTVTAGQQLVTMGLSAGGPTYWLSSDTGLTWLPKLRDLTVTMSTGTANTMAGTNTENWYGTWTNNNGLAGYVDQGLGDPAFTQQERYTPGTVEIGDIFKLTVSGTGGPVVISFTATAASVANVTAGLQAAWAASASPLCTSVTAVDNTTNLTLTGNVAGVPFSVAPSTTNGGATNNQTLVRELLVAAAPTYLRTPKSTTETMNVRSISSTGRAVGFRRQTSPGTLRRNYYLTWAGQLASPAQTFFDGLKADGQNLGEAWSITADGTKIVGFSPTPTSTDSWPYLYTVGGSAVALPTYPDVAGSTTRGVPYCISADGSFASGHNYRGAERAVLWDVRDANSANWKVYDLTAYLGAGGNLGAFSRLSRAYTVAVTATDVVVGGVGVTGASTNGWILKIPLADFPLPDTGACCMLGSCTSKFASDCPDVVGQQRYTVNYLCANANCPGACCNSSGTCSDFVVSGDCTTPGGNFRGSSTTCATGTCIGACCRGAGVCQDVAYGTCAGTFQNIGTACATTQCPCTTATILWADRDLDGDVDQDDFGAFQNCYTGPFPANPLPDACRCFDRSVANPNLIDQDDLDAFKACWTGAGVKYNLNNLPFHPPLAQCQP